MTAAVVLGSGLFEGTTNLFSLRIPLQPWVVLVLLALAGALFHFGLRSYLHRLAKRTETDLDDVLFEVSGTVIPASILLAIAYVATETLDSKWFDHEDAFLRFQSIVQRCVGIGAILLLFWTVTTLVLRSLQRWAAPVAAARTYSTARYAAAPPPPQPSHARPLVRGPPR